MRNKTGQKEDDVLEKASHIQNQLKGPRNDLAFSVSFVIIKSFHLNSGVLPPVLIPFLIISVWIVFSGRLLKPYVSQHVSHGHHQTVHLLVELLTGPSHLHLILQPRPPLENKENTILFIKI